MLNRAVAIAIIVLFAGSNLPSAAAQGSSYDIVYVNPDIITHVGPRVDLKGSSVPATEHGVFFDVVEPTTIRVSASDAVEPAPTFRVTVYQCRFGPDPNPGCSLYDWSFRGSDEFLVDTTGWDSTQVLFNPDSGFLIGAPTVGVLHVAFS